MRLKPFGALALAAAVGALCLAPAYTAATRGPTVSAALQGLQRSGSIEASVYQRYASAYQAAEKTLKKLSGTRRAELAAVITNVQAIAAAGGFIPSRLPALFLTLERNRQYWSSGSPLAYGQRITFPGSHIIWESYPGQGIEIQWLGTFGEANGYYLSGHENGNLKELLNEVIPLATQRAGGIAWEYMFRFDGGLPPWTSGLSQGTALQALSRAWSRFKEPAYLTAAQESLGLFKTPPPAGVRVATSAGAHYLEYTYAPSERILNGFIQAVTGIYDYAAATKDPVGLALFNAGDAEARSEVPHYDTGAWSMYDQHEESDLNYHELLTEFLKNLCQRTQQGEPFSTTTTSTTTTSTPSSSTTSTSTSTSTTSTSTTTSPEAGVSGGAQAASAQLASAKTATPIAGDQIYCTTAQHFTTDLHTPPTLALITRSLHGSTRAGVQFSISKISTVSLTVRKGSKIVWTNRATVAGGKPKILWVTPKQAGSYSVSLRAVDLAGNSSTATGTIALTAPAKKH